MTAQQEFNHNSHECNKDTHSSGLLQVGDLAFQLAEPAVSRAFTAVDVV
jgi:hypothetical protein